MKKKEKSGFVIALILMTLSVIQCCVIRNIIMAWEGSHHSAFAYLDPSTGAMIISAIVGIFATILLGVKTFWYKIASLFRRKKQETDQDKRI